MMQVRCKTAPTKRRSAGALADSEKEDQAKRGSERSGDDLFPIFIFYNECVNRTNGTGVDQAALVDIRCFVLEGDDVLRVDLEDFRGEIDTVARSNAKRPVNTDVEAANGAFRGGAHACEDGCVEGNETQAMLKGKSRLCHGRQRQAFRCNRQPKSMVTIHVSLMLLRMPLALRTRVGHPCRSSVSVIRVGIFRWSGTIGRNSQMIVEKLSGDLNEVPLRNDAHQLPFPNNRQRSDLAFPH